MNYLSQLKQLASNSKLPQAILLHGNLDVAFNLAKDFSRWILCDIRSNKQINNCNCAKCKVFQANNHPDYFVIDLGLDQEITIDLIRAANNFINANGYLANKKVIVINNFHNINLQAANAFLKTLEEPPNNIDITFLLVTNNSKILPNTILSRLCILNIVKKSELNLSSNTDSWNLDNNMSANLVKDLYACWVKQVLPPLDLVTRWQTYSRKELINYLWLIMVKLIKGENIDQLVGIKQKIHPNLPWQLLDSLNYINRMLILNKAINWQLCLHNLIMLNSNIESIYGRR